MGERRETVFVPTKRQNEFIEAVLSGKYRHLVYGGAVGGGKSYLACALLALFCRMWPGSRWALVRRDLPTMRRNTIPTFLKVKPTNFIGEINQSTWTARCTNGSEIVFFPESIEHDPELDRWKGLEVNGFFLEELNELAEASYNKAIERAGRWHVAKAKTQPPPLIIGTCNPSKGYVKRLFYDPWKIGGLKPPRFYLPAYVTDNPHLSAEYLANLKELPERHYNTFVMGDWDNADEPDQLIQSAWVEDAFKRGAEAPNRKGLRGLGVDVARYGDDDTALAEIEGFHLCAIETFHGIDTVRTALLTKERMGRTGKEIPAYRVRVDTVGLGAGVADQLYADKLLITEFVAGAKPATEHKYLKFKNLRSEAWWHVRELLREGRATFAPELRTRAKLIGDLTAPKYTTDSDRVIEVESKDEIKKRLGRSTDEGDAVVMAYAEMNGASEYLRKIVTR